MDMINDKKRKKPINWGKTSFIILHLALGTINFIVFYLFCNAYSFVMGFMRKMNGITYMTMGNFKFFFESISTGGELAEAFTNTFLWFVVNMSLQAIGFFVSYFLYKKIACYQFFRLAFFIPGLISSIVTANIWMSFCAPQGFFAQFVQKIYGLSYTPELLADSQFAMKTLIFRAIIFGFAGNMLLWCGTMSRIPDSVIESGKIDGVGWLREACQIVIPMILPTVAIQLCVSLSGIFGAGGGEWLLTGGDYGTLTYGTWLWKQVFGSAMDSNSHNVSAAAGWLTTLTSLPIVLITRKIANKISEGTEY